MVMWPDSMQIPEDNKGTGMPGKLFGTGIWSGHRRTPIAPLPCLILE